MRIKKYNNFKTNESEGKEIDRIEVDEDNWHFDYISKYIKKRFNFEDDVIDKIALYFSELLNDNNEEWSYIRDMLENFLDAYDGIGSLHETWERMYKHSLKRDGEPNPFKTNESESVPFEKEIDDIFKLEPNEVDDIRKTLGDKVNIETIEDEIRNIFDELESEDIDYENMTQSEFMEEFKSRIDLEYPQSEKVYMEVFKDLISNPDQLELNIENKRYSNLKTFNEYNNTDNLINHAGDYLVEDKWEGMVPENIKIDRNNEKATYNLRDKVKNMNSVILTYDLGESTTNTFSKNLTVNISFKEKNNRIDMPLSVEYETVMEITLGTLYVLGVKIYEGNKVMHFIDQKADIESKAMNKLIKLIEYITGVSGIKID
jgi:hypothetical protein